MFWFIANKCVNEQNEFYSLQTRAVHTQHTSRPLKWLNFFLSRFVSISLLLVGSLTQITKAMQLAAESRPALPRNLSPHHLSSEKSFRQILHVHTNDVDWILTNFVLHFLSRSIISTFWPKCLQPARCCCCISHFIIVGQKSCKRLLHVFTKPVHCLSG